LAKLGPLSPLEKRAAILLEAEILLWLTDFLHHISPAVIGMGVGLFAHLPRVGVLPIEDLKRLNYLPVFFVAPPSAWARCWRRPTALPSSPALCSAGWSHS
jgi:hypothetical protein